MQTVKIQKANKRMKKEDYHLHEQLVYEWSEKVRDIFFRPIQKIAYEMTRNDKTIVKSSHLRLDLIEFLRKHGYMVNEMREPGYAAKTRIGDIHIDVERAYSGSKVTHVLVRIAHTDVTHARSLGEEIKHQVLSETGETCIIDNTIFKEDC